MTATVRIAIPRFTRFTLCKACMKSIALVADAHGERVAVDGDGIPHAPLCTGTSVFRKRRVLEARLAELRADAGAAKGTP